MYEFSAPMPYNIENIDKLININNQIEKSRITSLFFSLPSTCELFTGFEQYRNRILNEDKFSYWEKLICYSIEKGVDFIYLLNSPARLSIENENFEKQLDKLDKLLIQLQKIGVKNLRIAEHKLMSYIEKHYPYFNIYASTSFEFKSLSEYKNFMFMHPTVKQIVPSSDTLKNFNFLKNLKKLLPKVEIELMINEGCINGCPNRFGHASEIMDRKTIHKNDLNMSNYYYPNVFCAKLAEKHPIFSIIKSNAIFPWEVKEYSKIGINKFKLVGRDAESFLIDEYIQKYLIYLKSIDNIKNAKNISINKFIHHVPYVQGFEFLTVKKIKKFLPNINHFKKHGELCAVDCGVNCFYCYKCAEKIEKLLNKKQEEIKKRTMPVCVITKQTI